MLSFWNNDLTVFVPPHDNIKSWSKTVYRNCFFKNLSSSTFADKQLYDTAKVTARLPGEISVSLGSIVVKGKSDDMPSDNSSGNELLKKYGTAAFRVNEISYNSAPLPHTRLGGS